MLAKDPLYYEKLGDDFDRFMSDYDVERRLVLLDNLMAPVPPGETLEIGCGTGRISQHLLPKYPELTVNDISEVLAERVATKLGCRSLAGDCSALPCEGDQFDLVVSSECIEHTLDPYQALREMGRVLRPGGWLVVTTPNRLHFPLLQVALKLGLRKFQGIENWTWPHSTRSWLLQNGFGELHFSGCHLFPWQLPGAKLVLPLLDRFGDQLYPLMINYGFRARKTDGAS